MFKNIYVIQYFNIKIYSEHFKNIWLPIYFLFITKNKQNQLNCFVHIFVYP